MLSQKYFVDYPRANYPLLMSHITGLYGSYFKGIVFYAILYNFAGHDIYKIHL